MSLVSRNLASGIAKQATDAPVLEADAEIWASGAHRLLGRFRWLSLQASGEPAAISAVLAHFATLESPGDQAARLTVESGARAMLDDVIVRQIAEEPRQPMRALSVLLRAEPNLDWGPFVEAAVNHLRNGAPSRGQERQPDAAESRALPGIMRIAEQAATQQRVALVSEGLALEYVWIASQEGENEALGDWFHEELLQYSPESSAERSYPGYASSGKNLLDALISDPSSQPVANVAQAIERQGDFEFIASIGALVEGTSLAAALVAELKDSEPFGAALTGDRFLGLWPHILRAAESGDLDTDKIVRVACSHPTFVTELCSGAFATNRIGMYLAVLSAVSVPEDANRLGDWIATSLSQLTQDQWGTVTNDTNWAALLASVHSSVPSARIGGAYAQGLSRFLEQVANGMDVDTSVVENWDRGVVPLMPTAIERAYIEGVARAAINAGGSLPGVFFKLVGDALRDRQMLMRADILDGFLPNIVAERSAEGLTWLIGALQMEASRCEEPLSGLDALAAVVPTSLGQDDEIDEQLRQIAELVGLNLEPDPNA